MAAKAKAAAAKRAAAAKKPPAAANTKTIPLVQHDPTRPPPLNLKDQAVFKQILHLYELKQYSAALQHCDTLLEKYPGHGETTAMAGLLNHSMNNKAQGYSLVKAGMKADLKSHIVWHVYGIITRADRNYSEAVKSYSQALRLDPENHNILRDLAVLQIQVRQYSAYVESRWKLLRSNRRSRTAWLSLAMAYKLNHQTEAALEVLDAMEKCEVIHEPEQTFERSETILFKASLLPPSDALDYLEKSSNLILDRPRYMLTRAQNLGELGRQEAAEWAWFDLLDTNSENRMYLEGYLSTRSKVANEDPVIALKRLAERYPTSQLIKRMILDHATGTQFDQELESYLCVRLTKGIPSLFNDLKPLLADSAKLKSIKTVSEKLHSQVSQHGYFESTKDVEAQQPSSTLVWILHFLSQLYGSSHLNMTKEAIDAAHQAIEHTPSLPDLYISLAHAYKRAGSFEKAADALRSARGLDGQDRFLNSKCAKYVLQSIGVPDQPIEVRIRLLEESRQLIGMFTRKDAPDPVSDLVDMQAAWYVMAEAEVALRASDWGMGLKRLHQVYEIFRQWEEDQYDFHTYCIRKNTFQTYQDLLKFEDRLYADPLYYKAVSKAVGIYLKLHDRIAMASKSQQAPLITEYNVLVTQTHSEVNPDSLPNENGGPKPEDDSTKSKKALKKAKMAEIKAKAQAALEAKKASSKNKNGDQASTATPDVIPPIPDDDPTGEKLLKTENPLEMANELLRPIEDDLAGLTVDSSVDLSKRLICQGVSLCRFEIELRRDKPLLALRALLKAHDLSPDQSSIDPSVFVALSKLKVKYLSSAPLNGSTPDTDSTTTTNVLQKALEKIEQLELSEGYRGRLARAESFIVQRTHKPSTSSTTNEDTELFSNKQIEDEIFSLFSSSNEDILNQWKIGLQGLQLLESFSSSRTEEFKSKAQDLWKFVDYFRPPPIGGNKQQDQLDSVPANNHFTHHPRHSNSIATDTPIPDGPATPQDHPDGSKTEGLVEVRDF
ncbi:uncharacterized protein PGTG_11174 [Puccinia graminis f. sp. tritici CRL 75-36-700-3]|uniref:N-alpha-acetyltransferase 15, NatA auxiliary subunit n=1 Tax=Puccinia graminis f. sp. tritici (strain CRL 75-36-700-3 / race SCCL) TaxID=418459 RepID=E3KL30_PUCGT|nr:uncharacterized protein PGTG_11174 [Puccinia graminis f. sp. tritici CRL 75-36-700-3]EFP85005.2 hypothetical protein PGTG_11174 [Puccinia graminis f. sp. tritici CRL 75-36-700-3]